MPEKKIVICIPTYNEAPNIVPIITAVLNLNPQVEVLVVDDNSPDGTADLVVKFQETHSRVHLLRRAQKEGLGPAYLAAFSWAAQRGYTWVGQFDADGSHRPIDLRRLVKCATSDEEIDLVIGSRWVKGGKTVGWPWYRQFLSLAGSFYARTVLRLPLRDVTAGFRLYRVDFLEKMGLDKVQSVGYGFQVEMTWRSEQAGAKIREVPITFVQRKLGESKMSGSIIAESFVKVLMWGIGR